MATHKECIHYVNGVCTLYNVPMNPEGPACPNFRPRQAVSAVPPPPAVPQMRWWPPLPGAGHRLRKRYRRRRGWGWRSWFRA